MDKKKKSQHEYTMQDILRKSAAEKKKQEFEEELYNSNTTGKRNTRNQILKQCEQEENFKSWKKKMLKEAEKTETTKDEEYIGCLKETSELFEDIVYDSSEGLDDSMPDFGTLSEYM